MAQRRIALNSHEILQYVHSCRRLHACTGRSVDLEYSLIDTLALDTPYEHQTDQDRVTCLVVHLNRIDIEVTGTHRDALLGHKGVYPPETRLVERTAVLTEEQQHASLVGFEHHKADRHNNRRDDQQDARNSSDYLACRTCGEEVNRRNDRCNSHRESCEDHKQRCKTIHFPA